MRFHDLVVTKWHAYFMGHRLMVSVGRNGIGNKTGEGDPTTPRGIYNVEEWLYRPDRLHTNFTTIHQYDGWSDDASDPNYNSLIKRPYPYSHESLRRADHLYDIIGVLDFNRNPIDAGAGSAIFLHAWRRPRFPTEGCVAFAPKDLRFIAENWQNNSRVVIE